MHYYLIFQEFGQKIMLPKECPPSEDSEWLLNTLLEKAEAAIFRSKREPIVIEEQDSEDRAVEYTVMVTVILIFDFYTYFDIM